MLLWGQETLDSKGKDCDRVSVQFLFSYSLNRSGLTVEKQEECGSGLVLTFCIEVVS